MAKSRTTVEATIPAAGTTSDTITVPNNATLVGFTIPAGAVGVAITFKASYLSTVTPVAVKKIDNTAYTVTIGATAAYHAVDPSYFDGASYLQLVSGSTETGGLIIQLQFAQL